MADLTLEPYAVVQRWDLPEAAGHWEVILGNYLQSLAQRCSAAGQCVIGHIKALALLPNKSYLRISVVAPHIPASIEGEVPSDCRVLELTLNVLVYGLERTVIERITYETSHEVAEQWKGVVNQKEIKQAGQHSHQSKHQDPKGEKK
jgi:hypothetical protein